MNGKESGFTLIEALVAITIVVVIVMAVMGLFTSAYSLNHRAERKTGAVLVAQREMDSLKALDPDTLPKSGTQTKTASEQGREYEVRLTYCSTPAYCVPGSRSVAIEVRDGDRVAFSGETVYTQVQVSQ